MMARLTAPTLRSSLTNPSTWERRAAMYRRFGNAKVSKKRSHSVSFFHFICHFKSFLTFTSAQCPRSEPS